MADATKSKDKGKELDITVQHLETEIAKAGGSTAHEGSAPLGGKKSSVRSTTTNRALSPSTRSTGTPREIYCKADTQEARLALLVELASQLNTTDPLSIDELNEVKAQTEELFRAFVKEHELMECLWFPDAADIPYFKDKYFLRAQRISSTIKRDIAKLKSQLNPMECSHPPPGTYHYEKLPELNLPVFDENYTEWSNFKGMFESMILRNTRLSSVEKLHYLRGQLKGEPAQLISALEICNESLQLSLDILNERYENKRLIIQSYLDKLMALQPLTTKSAHGLDKISRTLSDVYQGLKALKVSEQLGEMMLVCYGACNMDRSTKEAWETSLGTTHEFPSFERLDNFLKGKARALERVEQGTVAIKTSSTHATTSYKGAIKRTAHTTTTSSASSTMPTFTKTEEFAHRSIAHECDYCQGDHFIVACPHFRKLTVKFRRDLVNQRRLCYNCLGRHSVRACKSTHRCKTCNGTHHSMLHDQQGTTSREPLAQSPSSSTAQDSSSANTH